MPGDHSDDLVSDYRLAPTYGARLVGGLLVALAVLLFLATALVAVGLPADLVLVLAVLGVAGVLTAGYVVTRRVPVVHLGPEGYRVRLIRGVGVTAAGWTEVGEAVTTSPGGQPVLVLKLVDGRTTTIPVNLIEGDREEFVRELRRRLSAAHGRR